MSRSRTVPKGGNKPKKATVTTTVTLQARVKMTAPSLNMLNNILSHGATARLEPAGDGLYRIVAEHPEASIDEVIGL